MDDIKTVDDGQLLDPLLQKQKSDVAQMRAALLSCSIDPNSAPVALQNITVLRIYHQVARIIRYLDLMDKLEAKLYASIETRMDRMRDEDMSTFLTLMNIQTQLQKNMIESQKLLEPYMQVADTIQTLQMKDAGSDANPMTAILDKDSRDNVRLAAQNILAELGEIDGSAAS